MIFFTRDLAIKIEQAFVDSYLMFIRTVQQEFPEMEGDYLEFKGGIATVTKDGRAGSWVHGIGLIEKFEDSELKKIEEFYFDRKCKVRIQLSTMASPETFKALAERGFHLVEAYNATFKKIVPSDKELEIEKKNFEIREALPEEDELWATTMAEGFRELFSPEEVSPDIWRASFKTKDRINHIVFSSEKNPSAIGCSMLTVQNGIGMFNSASTLPDYRGMGVQSELIKTRIKTAAELGCEWVTLGAMDDSTSLRNAQRNGMEIVNSRLVMEKPFAG